MSTSGALSERGEGRREQQAGGRRAATKAKTTRGGGSNTSRQRGVASSGYAWTGRRRNRCGASRSDARRTKSLLAWET